MRLGAQLYDKRDCTFRYGTTTTWLRANLIKFVTTQKGTYARRLAKYPKKDRLWTPTGITLTSWCRNLALEDAYETRSMLKLQLHYMLVQLRIHIIFKFPDSSCVGMSAMIPSICERDETKHMSNGRDDVKCCLGYVLYAARMPCKRGRRLLTGIYKFCATQRLVQNSIASPRISYWHLPTYLIPSASITGTRETYRTSRSRP